MAKLTADQEQKQEFVKTLCKTRLKYLCKEFLGYKDWGTVHDDLEKFLARPNKRKLAIIPRNHLKSSVITKGWGIQQVLNNPNLRILIANAVWEQSRKFLGSIQKYLTYGSDLPLFFGKFESGNWNQFDCTVNQRNVVLDAPTFVTTGVDKEQTSQHYDIIIGDDLVGPQNVGTPDQRNKVFDYYLSLFDLLEPGGTLMILGTRYHQDDLYARILEEAESQKNWDIFFRTCYNDDGSVLFPQKFTPEQLSEIRNKPRGALHFACTPGYTPILMSDFKTKPIEQVNVGDEIIGFTIGKGRTQAKLVKTRVKRTFSKLDHVLSLGMESGKRVECTKDHKWYTGRSGSASHQVYNFPKIGRDLMFVCPVEKQILSEKEKQDWSYLAGLFDGEGSCSSGGTLAITQCESANPDVYSRMLTLFKDLKIPYGYNIRKESANRNQSPGNTQFWLKDSFRVGLNLIRETSCAKSSRIAERFLNYGARFIKSRDRIKDIRYVGEDTVYALETETGNYVAWGYASSNSQYMNNPIDPDSADFKQEWIKYYDPKTNHPASLYMTVDPAISLSKDADYTAMLVGGQFQNRTIRIVDYVHKRMIPSDLVDEVFRMVEKWNLHRIGLETFAFQKTLKYDIQNEQRRRNRFFSIDELGKRGATTENILSKEARIRRLQPLFEQGLFEIRADMQDFRDELLAFPRGKHDDLIDCAAWMLDYLVPSQNRIEPVRTMHGSMKWWVDNHSREPQLSTYQQFMKDLG